MATRKIGGRVFGFTDESSAEKFLACVKSELGISYCVRQFNGTDVTPAVLIVQSSAAPWQAYLAEEVESDKDMVGDEYPKMHP